MDMWLVFLMLILLTRFSQRGRSVSRGGQRTDHFFPGCSRLISISRWGWARHVLAMNLRRWIGQNEKHRIQRFDPSGSLVAYRLVFLFVCPHRTFIFFSATACRIETTYVECFNDNYDIIGHVVWQPCWKNRKTLDLCVSETTPRTKLKLGTQQVLLMENKSDFFLMSQLHM